MDLQPLDNPILSRILSSNAQWALDVEQDEPGFFAKCAEGQSPKILWIGCSDSRVPESVITGSRPGDVFVHRNIANQFNLDDPSALAVLGYAVEHLGVEHVIIVGHTECGGATSCFTAAQSALTIPVVTVPSSPPDDPLNIWLAPLTTLAASLHLSSTPVDEALPILVEENVKVQVQKLCKARTILNAWAEAGEMTAHGERKEVWVHGWVYELGTGTLRDLGISQGPSSLKTHSA